MKFWDASALVPLFANEKKTPDVRNVLVGDAEVVLWWCCRTEVKSTVYRRVRERVLTASDAA